MTKFATKGMNRAREEEGVMVVEVVEEEQRSSEIRV